MAETKLILENMLHNQVVGVSFSGQVSASHQIKAEN